MIRIIDGERGNHEGFDIAVILDAGANAAEWEAAGATWAMRGVIPGEPLEMLWTLVEAGPNANRRPM
jgi:hypothetical protein